MAVDLRAYLSGRLASACLGAVRVRLMYRQEECGLWTQLQPLEALAQDLIDSSQMHADTLGMPVNLVVEALDAEEKLTGKISLRAKPSEGANAMAAPKSMHHSELSEALALSMRSNTELIRQSQGLMQQAGVGMAAMAAAQSVLVQSLAQRLTAAESRNSELEERFRTVMGFATELESELKSARSTSVKLDKLLGVLMGTPLVRQFTEEPKPAPAANANGGGNGNGAAKS